jgi:hypothetical protein
MSVLHMVDLTMTVRANSAHEPWIVWAAIAEAVGMMGLEVGRALQSQEWSRLLAALASLDGPREHIAPNSG